MTEAGASLLASGDPQVTTGAFGSTSVTSVRFSIGSRPSSPVEEWADVGRLVSHAWSAAQASRTAEQRQREGQLLVGDEDRDAALHELAAAYGEGCLTQEEHDRRTDVVFQARTRADLDAVCSDLPASESDRRTGTARRTAFLVVALLSVPLLLLAVLLVSGGEPRGGAVGLGLLAILVPGLLALWSWAYRHRPHLRT